MISSIFNFSSLSFSKLKEILLTNENKNFEIKGYIISHMKIQNQNYINLNIQIGENCCKEFIYYDETGSIEDGNEIIFNLNKIKFSSVHNQCYIEIFDPKINKSKIKSNKSVPLFNFEIFQFVSSYNEIIFNNKQKDLFSIILKVKQIEKKDKCEYTFYDINDEKVPVNYLDIKNEIEGQRIYIFNSFKYTKDSNDSAKLMPLKYSKVVPINYNNIIYNQNFIINKDEKVASFFGEIISFILAKNEIEVIDKDKNKVTVELNTRLFKKVFLGCQCKFECFWAKNQSSFKYTNFSNIISYEKTTILFDFIGKNRDYEQIQIDNDIYDLNNRDKIECQIKFENDDKIILDKEIRLKSKKNNIESSYTMEINRGKQNISNLYLGKEGKYAYQIYTQVDNEEKLQKEFNLTIDGKNIKLKNYDSFGNKLKNRITLINIPVELCEDNNKNSEKNINNSNNSFKILKLIGYNEKEYKFKLLFEKEEKRYINYNEFNLNLINSFYNKYYFDIYNLWKDIPKIKLEDNKFHNLFYGKKEITKFEKYIKQGFDMYILNDNEKDYNFIKKICFAYLFNTKKCSLNMLSFLNSYKKNILDMNDLDFIERIRILITLTKEYSKRNKNFQEISLSIIGESNYYNSVNKAHNIFLEIIDGLLEDCSLFHTLNQFNSIIRLEVKNKENMYSGSLLSVNDIKIEIYKYLNRFYLISGEENLLYGAIYKNTKVIIIYYQSITNSIFEMKEPSEDEEKRISSAILMVLFHEICGHLKTHINNKLDSPRSIILPNFDTVNLNLKQNDSGYLLEFFFVRGLIEVEKFIYSEKSEKLLNKNLYLGKNFLELNNILISIDSSTIIKEDIKATCDLLKFDKKNLLKEKDLQKNLLKLNYKNMSYLQLTQMFAEMDEKQFNENEEAYKYYLSEFFSDPDKKC